MIINAILNLFGLGKKTAPEPIPVIIDQPAPSAKPRKPKATTPKPASLHGGAQKATKPRKPKA